MPKNNIQQLNFILFTHNIRLGYSIEFIRNGANKAFSYAKTYQSKQNLYQILEKGVGSSVGSFVASN